MSKKKRKSEHKRPGHFKAKPPSEKDLPELPDPRAMEKTLRDLLHERHGRSVGNTPQERAQVILQAAFETKDKEQRIHLAQEALNIYPDCADAYVLLAELNTKRKQRRQLYEQGIAAAERSLGPEAFQHSVGHFWGILETRPYMRARLGLAHSLWTSGQREEAVRHLQEMLRLNPNDNQGIRYTLAGFLLFLDRDAEVAALLEQHADDATAAWAFTRALLSFRQHGDTVESRQLLKKAKKTNKHVVKYLLGRKHPPYHQPDRYSLGQESEALIYLGSFLVSWKATPGAIAWLRANVKLKHPKPEPPQPKGPLGFIKKWLQSHLPQATDVWQADSQQFPNWLNVTVKPMRPWIVLVSSRTHDLMLGHQMPEAVPSSALLWDMLVQTMQHPAAGEPHRPSELQVRADERWEALRPHLEEIGVRLEVVPQLDQLDKAFQGLLDSVGGRREPGLLEMPNVKPEMVADLYEAAAFYFQHAPWKRVGFESAIRIESDKIQSGPQYAVVMGQSGLSTGLAVYEDLATLRRIFNEDLADEERGRESVATAVTFDEAWEIPVADLEAAQKYGWKVARPDAYPSVIHKQRGLAMRPPLAWELELMTACLRTVPEFVQRRPQEDPTPETFTVEGASGPAQLVLSWVVEETPG